MLCLLPLCIFAQQQSYVFQHITPKDGLATDRASCIFQDSKGYYWVATENGLQRFDGKNFSSILSRNGGKDGFSSVLLEDKEGNIWAHSGGAIAVYHSLTGKCDNIEIHDDSTNLVVSNIQHFCKDEWGNMWILTYLNLYKYDYKQHKAILWIPIFNNGGITQFPYNYPWAKIVYDSTKKSLWIVGGHSILLVTIKTKSITTPFLNHVFQKPMLHEELAYQFPVALFLDSKQNLWFSVWQGFVYKFNTCTFQKEEYDVRAKDDKNKKQYKPLTYCFNEDNNGKIWIGTEEGFFYYDKKNNRIQAVSINNKIPYSVQYEKAVYDLCKDREGNVLACTDKGISVLTTSSRQFTTLDENNLLNPFPQTSVTKIFETSTGAILASTWGHGWLLYDKNFRLKKQFYNNNPPTDWQQYKRNMVWSFAEDKSGKIWIGYQYGLIGIYDTVTQHIQYLDVPEFDKKTIRTMASDSKGNIWFGLHSGFLSKWDATKRKFIIYKNSLQFTKEYAEPICNILINKHNEIWIATEGNGFYRFDPEQDKIVQKYSFKNRDSGFDYINSLTQINDSIIGVAAASNGVLLFNEKQKTFTSITTRDGLPVNDIYGLAQDRQENLWIATTNGLSRINVENHKLVLFDEEDGVLAKRFDYNITLLQDGRMAIPAYTGVVYFSPDKISISPAPPDVQFTNFKVFNKELLIDSLLNGNNTIELDHTQNFITISYASLSFSGINTMQYFYKLQGVDKDWVAAGTHCFASYTNLSPGHYTFKVQCQNRDGIPSKNISTLSIYIHHPWWFTWWAYCVYALFAVGITFSLYRNRINQLEGKQATQIKAMVATQEEERKRISRDIHDDIGTKLSALNLFLSCLHEKATKTNNDEITSLAKSAEQFIKEAMQDVRQLLLNLSPTVLEEFGYTTAVEGLVNKINETKQIHFSLVVFGMHHRLQKDYELALYRITQELINNVLKHAEAKHVSLQIGVRDEKLILLMEDDGKGFDMAAHKDGYGLHNLDARARLMHGTIAIDSRIGNGTSVLIEIPYNLN